MLILAVTTPEDEESGEAEEEGEDYEGYNNDGGKDGSGLGASV